MYPLLLKPAVKDYLWGGNRLINEYGYETDLPKAAEAWVLSCHKDGESIVKNGEFGGKTLSETLKIWGKSAIGKNADKFPYFPILIKLIDAKDRLSVQVHPDDEYALKNEGEFGKTEMWYIVDCDEGAELIYGFKTEIDKEEFRRRAENNTLTEVCNFVPVKKGDVFFIESGTLHAIGKGILIAEIQQNSNTTYRVSDYGRIGVDGKPRPLHIEKALEVTKTEPLKAEYGAVGNTFQYDFGTVRKLAECKFFTTELIKLDGTEDIHNKDSFTSLLVLDGNAVLSGDFESIKIKKGDSVFIPSDLTVKLSGKSDIICSRI